MFGFRKRAAARMEMIERLHGAVVAASRAPHLYGSETLPDTVEGRFESLVLHALLVLRRLRALPSPAADVAQDFIDSVFAYLEIAMRESGVGDMGVSKRMKKLARAYYDRTLRYEAALNARDPDALAAELARRVGVPATRFGSFIRHLGALETRLAAADLDGVLGAGVLAPAELAAP